MDMSITQPNKIQVALIGPDDRVQKVLAVAREFPYLNLRVWVYQDEEETLSLFHKAAQEAEVVVFTGTIPYYITTASERPSVPLLYVPLTGSGLMRTLFNVFITDQIKVNAFSIDNLEKNVVLETLEELGQPNLHVYAKEFEGTIPSKELVDFHYELWKAGKINVALTCLRSAYYRLKELGVPTYRVVATNSAIRETLTQAIMRGEQLRAKDTQVSVQICEIDDYSGLIKRSSSEYAGERIKISLQNLLNDYAERIWASVHPDGNDRFTIFTTRGMLERVTDFYQSDPLLERARNHLATTVSIGTGFGQTAYHAELNAQKALNRAKAFGGDCSFVMTNDGRLFGPIGKSNRLEYSVIENKTELLALAQKANLGIETITKLVSLTKTLGQDTLVAPDLAHGLNISPKSARRILKRLLDAGLAEIWAKEQATATGRPRMIYRVHLQVPQK